jgi:hypothetical protein
MALGTMNYKRFYEELFREVEARFGDLDEATLTAIVGFSAGGPVSLCTIVERGICATCELAAYAEQHPSAEGLRFELLSTGDFPIDWCRAVFSALGGLSMETSLGHGHTGDISTVVDEGDPITRVRLELFSTADFEGERYGVYRVAPL